MISGALEAGVALLVAFVGGIYIIGQIKENAKRNQEDIGTIREMIGKYQEDTKDLIEKIASFPHEIHLCSASMEPSKLTRYVMDLSALFHSFYNSCKVMCEDKKLMEARLLLCHATKIVIKNVFDILKVEAPEKMW